MHPQSPEFEQEFAFQNELVEELRPKAYRDPSRMGQLMVEVHALAELWLCKGAFHQAEALYRRILYRLLDAPVMDGELILGISTLLAELQVRWGEPQGGRELYEKAAELAARLGISSSPTLSLLMNNLGHICKGQGDFEKATYCYEEALAGYVSQLGAISSEVADVSDNVGALNYRMMRLEDALEMHQKAHVIRIELGTKGDEAAAAYARTCRLLVLSHRSLGQFQEAGALAQEAADIAAKLGPLPPPSRGLHAALAVDDSVQAVPQTAPATLAHDSHDLRKDADGDLHG
ncbi:tetratricopeptide repeat protein [Verrucomicrobium spinosum]|uniref:tetratricopeptide repeat protein n=1 Tax=Verrucomicrobium spinosum TaxID=2736 RepID=UPI0009467E2A|nr:tetratricopeptide repeat protein [Verrucomicrobium spinosum]